MPIPETTRDPDDAPVGWVEPGRYERAVERGRDALLRVRALRVALTRLADAADEAAVSANIGTMDDAIKTARDVLEECK
jgi:hypothetical protein